MIYKNVLKDYDKAYVLFKELSDVSGVIGLKSLRLMGEINFFTSISINEKVSLTIINSKLDTFYRNYFLSEYVKFFKKRFNQSFLRKCR